MKLICKSTGKELKVGSTVNFNGDKCMIDAIAGQTDIGLERISDGISWDMIEPESFGAAWDEEDFVNDFFKDRERDLAAYLR